jgi:signal transduction histidine kinase
MVDRAVHRVVQESLTNASKHAPGAEVTVALTQRAEIVEVRVTNTAAAEAVTTATSGGRGLAGLNERVRLVGGTLSATPRSTGGFEVTARIPRAGGRPEAEAPVESATADERATVRRNARRA